jgi:ribosomal protein S25
MHKPGSHRGAASVKKKKFGQEKKKPIPLMDKLRELIAETKIQAEDDAKHNRYVRNYLSCHALADQFNCNIGEVIVCVNKLMHEGITSSVSKRHKSFHVNYKQPQTHEKEIDTIFRFDKCPVCDKELNKRDSFRTPGRWGFQKESSQDSILVDFNDSCKNGCFTHSGHKVNNCDYIKVTVFDKKFDFIPNVHKSIRNSMVKDIEKEIGRMKKNERYVIEILMKDL